MLTELKAISEGNKTNLMMKQRTKMRINGVRDFLNEIESCPEKLAGTESNIGDAEKILKVCNSVPKSREATIAGFTDPNRYDEEL